MTRRCWTAALAIAAVLPLWAQNPRPRVGGARRLDFLAGYLGLTDAQKTQAKAIFDAADSAAETARGQLAGARNALLAAAKANQNAAQLDALAANVGAIEGQLAAIHAKAIAQFYALLTADQKAKYDQIGDRMGPGPGPGRRRFGNR